MTPPLRIPRLPDLRLLRMMRETSDGPLVIGEEPVTFTIVGPAPVAALATGNKASKLDREMNE